MSIYARCQWFCISLVCLLLFLSPNLWAAELTGPVFVDHAPNIDGVIDDPVWDNAFEVTDFKVIDPETRETSSLHTCFKFLYDKKNLYIGVINEQPAATQVKRVSARDQENTYVDRDMLRVMIDPTAQGLYGYVFDVYLGGSLTDGTIRPEREYSYNWDGPYRALTSQDDHYWYAEYSIPWDAMQFPKNKGKRIIGFYLQRDVAYLSERWGHPAISINAPVFLHDFNKMDIEHINPKGNLTLFPYATVGYDGVLGERTQDVGLDAFWQATNDMLVSATINPDFGDVENDEIEANFDTTETLLQEKRTFFVQGSDIFETKGLDLINTRRIGDAPDEPNIGSAGYTYKPRMSDILGAVKLTGSAKKMRYGVITAFEDDSEFYLDTGLRAEAEGRKYYGARALFETHSRKSDYLAFGYLGTFVEHEAYDALVNSVDAQWLTFNQKLRFEAQVAASDVDDETGYAYNGKIIYYPTPTSHLFGRVDLMDSKFNHNDFGYSPRLDRTDFEIEYRNNLSHVSGTKWFQYMLFADGDYNKGHLLETNIGLTIFTMLDNLQKAFIKAYYVPEAWDDAVTYQQKAFRTDEGWFLWLSWFSDESKPFHVYINPRYYTEKTGGITKYYRVRVKYSPLDRWTMETEVAYWNKQHWLVGRQSDTRVDAFNADQIQITFKNDFKLSPRQELRMQIQWLGIDAEDKIAYEIGPYGHLRKTGLETSAPRDFDYGQFVGQVRYKFEFAPLCDLFVVYNRAGLVSRGIGAKTNDFGKLLFDSYDKRDQDKFLVKIRYRF